MQPSTPREPSALGTLVFIMWGAIVWGLQLTAVYVGHTWLCALRVPAVTTDVLMAALTALAITAILPILAAPGPSARFAGLRTGDGDSRHLTSIARVIAALSLVATLWTGATAVFLQACAFAR
jgi:hypothetical protein